MTKRDFAAPKAAPPVGPYSPAIEAGGFVFLSGQIPLDGDGAVVGATATEQAKQALENLVALLKAAGLTTDSVVKTTIFLTDIGDFLEVNEVYAGYFAVPCPARSTVQVAALPKGVKVEIEAVAARV